MLFIGAVGLMVIGGLIFGSGDIRRRIWKGAAWIGGTVTVLALLIVVVMHNADQQRATKFAAECANPSPQNLNIHQIYECPVGSAARRGN